MATLAHPSEQYKDSFIQAVHEFQQEGRYEAYDVDVLSDNFVSFVKTLLDKAVSPRPDRVPETVYWLVEEDEFLGRVSIRHELTGFLPDYGGHIGYEIRPTERRRGYGTLSLKLVLPKARELGLNRVLLTCDDTNIGSIKIIEANGGVHQDTRQLDYRPVPIRRYWIDIP